METRLKTPQLSTVGQAAQKFPYKPEPAKADRPRLVLTVELPTDSVYPAEHYPALTDEEVQDWLTLNLPALLVAGQKEKHHILEARKLAAKIEAEKFVPETAEQMLTEVKKRAAKMASIRFWRKPFALTEWNEHIYLALCLYFTGDPDFETVGAELLGLKPGELSLHKGLLIAGPAGVGKSDMLELFARNPYAPYEIVSCVELENEYSKKDGGPNVIDKYSGLIPNLATHKFYGHSHLGVLFDDFGAEGEAVHMGKRVSMMDTLLQTRYRAVRGPFTHLTTNASQKQIQDVYDGRVYDRMIQMFNLIEFHPDAPSLRL